MKEGTNQVIKLKEKFTLLDEIWIPKIVGDLDNSHLKIIKVKGGELAPHSHKSDEFILVLKGKLKLKLPDRDVIINEGEFFVSLKETEHCPYAEDETYVIIIEKKRMSICCQRAQKREAYLKEYRQASFWLYSFS